MEDRTHAADHEGHGGMIVMVRADPAESARLLAHDLHAELILGGSAALELLVRLAAEHPRRRSTVDDSRRSVDATLDDLTVAMRRAETVRDATRTQAAQRLAATLNTRIAIHPDTIRRAAMELLSIRRDLAGELEAAIRRSVHRRRALVASGGALVLLVAGATAALLGWMPGAIVGSIAAAIAIAIAITSLLSARSVRSPVDIADLHGAECAAQRRWEQVSPPHTAPELVEQVIHRYEPQHQVVAALIGEHPAVRAAERAAVARRMAWVGAWREALGDDAPLATGPHAHRLQADILGRDTTEVVLTGPPSEGAILVVASPYDDLTDADALRLHRHLLDPPGGRRVIVILPPDPDVPSGARLPGTGWMPSNDNGLGVF